MRQCSKALELLEKSGFRLRNLLFKMTLCENTADDLMQELFLKLAGSQGFGHCRNGYTYAWRTAVNLVMDHRRRRKISPLSGEQDIVNPNINVPVDKPAAVACLDDSEKGVGLILLRDFAEQDGSCGGGAMDVKAVRLQRECSFYFDTVSDSNWATAAPCLRA